jgi:hypothetical protein
MMARHNGSGGNPSGTGAAVADAPSSRVADDAILAAWDNTTDGAAPMSEVKALIRADEMDVNHQITVRMRLADDGPPAHFFLSRS